MTRHKKYVGMLLAGALAGGIVAMQASAQSSPATASPGSSTSAPAAGAPYRFQPAGRNTERASRYYSMVWGVDSLSVKATESGEIIRFSYRILDPDKAKVLNDKKFDPALICPEKGVKLIVPSLEQVGMLRQSSTPIAGKVYWMAFSNSGRPVRRGDRVTITIGDFRAEGLNVD
jgi:hypothetical protein